MKNRIRRKEQWVSWLFHEHYESFLDFEGVPKIQTSSFRREINNFSARCNEYCDGNDHLTKVLKRNLRYSFVVVMRLDGCIVITTCVIIAIISTNHPKWEAHFLIGFHFICCLSISVLVQNRIPGFDLGVNGVPESEFN